MHLVAAEDIDGSVLLEVFVGGGVDVVVLDGYLVVGMVVGGSDGTVGVVVVGLVVVVDHDLCGAGNDDVVLGPLNWKERRTIVVDDLDDGLIFVSLARRAFILELAKDLEDVLVLSSVAKAVQVDAFVLKRLEEVVDVGFNLERRRELAFNHLFGLLLEESLEDLKVDLLALLAAEVVDLGLGDDEASVPSVGGGEGLLGQLMFGEVQLVLFPGVPVGVFFLLAVRLALGAIGLLVRVEQLLQVRVVAPELVEPDSVADPLLLGELFDVVAIAEPDHALVVHRRRDAGPFLDPGLGFGALLVGCREGGLLEGGLEGLSAVVLGLFLLEDLLVRVECL